MELGQEYQVKTVRHPHPIRTSVPGSKSITNRALLITALAEGRSRLTGILFSDDSRHFLGALMSLGFAVQIDEPGKCVTIEGQGGRIPKREAEVNVGSAGTAARFLTALLAFSDGEYQMEASEQMKRRPMQDLLVSLEQMGAEFIWKEQPYHFPFSVRGRGCGRRDGSAQKRSPGVLQNTQENPQTMPTGLEMTIDVEKSSQFLSALLMVSVLLKEELAVHVRGSHGMAYVEMTVRMMEQFGFVPQKTADGYYLPGDAHYRARDYRVEPDLSAACYFYAAGALLGVETVVEGVRTDSLQGDEAFVHVLEDMGCSIEERAEGLALLPPKSRLCVPAARRDGWDLSAFSDQALTLAAVAHFADAPVCIRKVGHIRYQECDRIEAILHNLRAMGVACEESDGDITIYPATEDRPAHGARIQTYQDHRVAMAFSIPGLLLEGQIIESPSCCRKTFENYFEVLEADVCD